MRANSSNGTLAEQALNLVRQRVCRTVGTIAVITTESVMAIELKDVENIAHLARLQLSPAEQQEALNSISSILELIDQMQAVDTTGVEPLAHASAASQRLREDVVTEPDQRDLLLKLAPHADKGLYLVPKVLE